MKKDKEKTEVVFLFNDYENDLFAFFPNESYSNDPNDDFYTSYCHVGQHSACHIDYANDSRFATKEEYKDLKKELEELGYNLTILKYKKEIKTIRYY
jgi:hypothetical protein